MNTDKKECDTIYEIISKVKDSLLKKDTVRLRELSISASHPACSRQDPGSITLLVLIYALGKIIEREDYRKIRNWDSFVKKFNASLDLAAKAISENNSKKYGTYIEMARKTLTSNSINLKPYIEDVVKKASINRGSQIYENGISLEQTSKLLGITQWELSNYVGEKNIAIEKENRTIDIKKRAKLAMEIFQ